MSEQGKIRVLHLVEDLKVGGLEMVIASIVLGLDKTKYQSQVWCLAQGGDVAAELIGKGASVRILGEKSYYNPLRILHLARLIWKEKFKIIHTHGYFASTFGRTAGLIARVPVIITHVHTTYHDYKLRNILIENILSRFTDRIIFVSKAVQISMIKNERIREDKTCVIYNGATISSPVNNIETIRRGREQLGIDKQDRVIIIVASLTPNKGHSVLLDAFAQVVKKYPHMKLLIVGDGPLMEELLAVTAHLDLSSKVIFTGRRRDVASLLQLADIFVLSSITREGLGIALIEAMAMGLPVIGTKVGGIPEVIEHNVNGLLVSPGNPGELAAALEALEQDGNMRERMGKRGKEIYVKKFTMTRMIGLIENLYDELLEKKGHA